MDKEALSFIQKYQYDGSDLYYSLLYQDKDTKPLLSILFAIEYEVIEITTQIQDLGIARQKLHWWQEELERYQDSKPRHPLTKALEVNTKDKELLSNRLMNAVINCQSLLLPYCFTSIKDFQEKYKDNIGEFWVVTNLSNSDNENFSLLGQCTYYIRTLKSKNLLQQSGREVLPKDHSILDAYKEIMNALENIKIEKNNSVLQYAWVMKKLLLLHCKSALKKQDEEFIGITPLRKLVCARLKV